MWEAAYLTLMFLSLLPSLPLPPKKKFMGVKGTKEYDLVGQRGWNPPGTHCLGVSPAAVAIGALVSSSV